MPPQRRTIDDDGYDIDNGAVDDDYDDCRQCSMQTLRRVEEGEE